MKILRLLFDTTDSTKQQINLILRWADLKRTNLSIATFVWGALARLWKKSYTTFCHKNRPTLLILLGLRNILQRFS